MLRFLGMVRRPEIARQGHHYRVIIICSVIPRAWKTGGWLRERKRRDARCNGGAQRKSGGVSSAQLAPDRSKSQRFKFAERMRFHLGSTGRNAGQAYWAKQIQNDGE